MAIFSDIKALKKNRRRPEVGGKGIHLKVIPFEYANNHYYFKMSISVVPNVKGA